jgi:5'-nucleotidase
LNSEETMPTLLLSLLVLACTGKPPVETGEDTSLPDDGKQRLTILHTNDWQSHVLGFGPNAEYTPDTTGDDATVGGLARMKTLIDEIRGATPHPVQLYDGGDWMAGSLFQLLATSHAAELQMMEALGFDAITPGNHEFDWGPQVLGQMISRADALGVNVPIVASNTHPNPEDDGDDLLEVHFDSGRIETTRVQVLDNGLRIGLLGIVGDSAQAITPAVAPSSFSDAATAAQEAVASLQAEGVDLVVALSHSGVSADVEMTDAVPGIDVVVGGHSHTALHEIVLSDNSIIVQAGALTQYLGQLDLAFDGTTWEVEGYQLHELDDSIAGDAGITAAVTGFLDALETGPLAELGRGFADPTVSIPGDVERIACGESGLGNLITDAYRQQLSTLDPSDPIDFAFESQGVYRDDFHAGATGLQTFSDVFRILPLGVGNDAVPGYSVVDFYLQADEVLDACEVTASVSPSYGCSYFLEVSGLRCNLDMTRTQFNRAVGIDAWVNDTWVPIDTSAANTALYHVAVDSYVASLMDIIGPLTYGAINVAPRDETGAWITDLDQVVFDKDPNTDGVQELKLWQALEGYLATFPDGDGDGVPDLSDAYLGPDGRIVGYE